MAALETLAALVIGQFCGKYRLIESIGRGGVGEVFRAEHDLTGEVAAVTVFAESLSRDQATLDRVFDDARATTRLAHPSIVRVLDYGRVRADVEPGGDDGDAELAAYMAMDFLAGESLQARLDRDGPLGLELGLSVAGDVAEALAAAHAIDIAHGLLRPSSIFIVKDPAGTMGVRAVVLDFGISRLAAAEQREETSAAEVLAPEWRAKDDAGPAADIYSLGCVLYRILTGKPAIDGSRPGGFTVGRIKQDPAPLTVHVPTAPAALTALIGAMLAKDPAARPSASELATRLIDVGDIVADIASGLVNVPSSEGLYAEDELTVLDSDALGPMPTHQSVHEMIAASRSSPPPDTFEDAAVDEDIEVDLPAPVPRKAELAQQVRDSSPPPLAVADTQDDLGPRIRRASDDGDDDDLGTVDLPAPVSDEAELVGLPAPVARSRHADLLAPRSLSPKKPAGKSASAPAAKAEPLEEPPTIDDLGSAGDPLEPPSPVTFRPASGESKPPPGGELALLKKGESKEPVALGGMVLVTDAGKDGAGGLAVREAVVEKGGAAGRSKGDAKKDISARAAAKRASKRKGPGDKAGPIDPILASMIEDSALGDDAPTMIVPAAIDASLLAEDEERSKDRRPHPTSPPRRIGGGMALPDLDDEPAESRIPPEWIKWGAIGGGVILVLLIFLLARSCDDGAPAGGAGPDEAAETVDAGDSPAP